MAQSRLEKVGTIYSRVTSLLKSGAMKEENKPLWLEIYRRFPPKYEPHYARQVPNIPLRKIFYSEDAVRVKFHKDFKQYSMINLTDKRGISRTEQFLTIYKELERKGVPQQEIYERSVEEFLTKLKPEPKPQHDEDSSSKTSKPRVILRTKKINKEDTTQAEDVGTEGDTKYKPIKLRLDKIMDETEENTKKPE